MSTPYYQPSSSSHSSCTTYVDDHELKRGVKGAPAATSPMALPSEALRERTAISIQRAEVILDIGAAASRTPAPFPMDRRALSHASASLEPYLGELQRILIERGYVALEAGAAYKLSMHLFKPATRTSRGDMRLAHHLSMPANLYFLARQHQMYGWDNPNLHATLEDIAVEEPTVLDILRLLQCVLHEHLDIILSSTIQGARHASRRTLPEPRWFEQQQVLLRQVVGDTHYRILLEASHVQELRILRDEKERARCGGVCDSQCANLFADCCTHTCGFVALLACMCNGC